MKTLNDFLIETNGCGGCDEDNDSLFGTLEEMKTFSETEFDKGWYTQVRTVKEVEIDGSKRFFAYYSLCVDGDPFTAPVIKSLKEVF